MEEAFRPLLQKMDDNGFNFNKFDQDNDGTLDMVVFLHSGYPAELQNKDCFTGATYLDRIGSFASSSFYDGWRSTTGIQLGSYVVAAAYRGFCHSNVNRLGTIVHEFIHTFGIPDLYDLTGPYNGAVSAVGGLGGYDIM
jgi:M6 family metalloprotease-like protein